MNIAMDGPAGAGKSTVAKAVSKKLDIHYLDTGAMYRGIAYAILKSGIDTSDKNAVAKSCDEIDIEVKYEGDTQLIFVDGDDVTPFIRTAEISNAASAVATVGKVREKLVALQREVAQKYDVVMDGRDIGSFVLPDADYKFYITASSAERARRRYEETKDKSSTSIEQIEKEIIARDKNDMEREIAPLKICDDAVVVDTTSMNIEEVVAFILNAIK